MTASQQFPPLLINGRSHMNDYTNVKFFTKMQMIIQFSLWLTSCQTHGITSAPDKIKHGIMIYRTATTTTIFEVYKDKQFWIPTSRRIKTGDYWLTWPSCKQNSTFNKVRTIVVIFVYLPARLIMNSMLW